jgi:hypothetical protein
MRRIDVDDAWLADELQSEIDGDRGKCPNSRVDLRLNEGHRNRPLPGFDEHVFAKSSAPCGPFHDPGLINAKPVCDPLDQARDLERSPAGPCASRYVIGFAQSLLLEAPVVLAHQEGKARREQVELHPPSHAPRVRGKLRDKSCDAVSTKAEEAR